ncbi:hypothetical protein OBBRIDRAFT_787175 [Obba rivulosa]|uniref:PXA domain-containing protein n=1 Tax=Obba rivulosa TaxID=1052685 RepID=A0A8E2DVF5_9APHY|nr:hypothetical protein OBBRIDRAFT_787175 [Obba rivulosa]
MEWSYPSAVHGIPPSSRRTREKNLTSRQLYCSARPSNLDCVFAASEVPGIRFAAGRKWASASACSVGEYAPNARSGSRSLSSTMAATPLAARPRRPPVARSIQSTTSSLGDRTIPTSTPASKPKPISLVRRLLFPQLPADAPLPSLLAHPRAAPLDAELYDFIALALRAFVNPWWTKITRYDREFLPAITRVLAHVLRAFEARARAADLAPLVFRDVPAILTQHVSDFRAAQAKAGSAYAAGGAMGVQQLFHGMQQHMAVGPNGTVDEEYMRQAVDYILKACLPPEDYEPETERYIVREIIVKVLRDVIPKVSQPWFIHKTILDAMGQEDRDKPPESLDPSGSQSSLAPARPPLRRTPSAFSFQSLAITILSFVQTVSGVCLTLLHTYKQTRDTIKRANEQHATQNAGDVGSRETGESTNEKGAPNDTHDAVLPGALMLSHTLDDPSATPAHLAASPAPTRERLSRTISNTSTPSTIATATTTTSIPSLPHPAPASSQPAPDYVHPPLALLLALLTPPPPPPARGPAHTSRSTALALAHVLTLPLGLLVPLLARILPYLLYEHVLAPAPLAKIVRSARRALFPEGWPAPPVEDPSPEEQVELRREVGSRLLHAVPAPLGMLLGPTPDAREYAVDAALAPFEHAACNAHLVMFMLDRVLLALFPEMGVSEGGAGENVSS